MIQTGKLMMMMMMMRLYENVMDHHSYCNSLYGENECMPQVSWQFIQRRRTDGRRECKALAWLKQSYDCQLLDTFYDTFGATTQGSSSYENLNTVTVSEIGNNKRSQNHNNKPFMARNREKKLYTV